MKIVGASRAQIEGALARANKHFHDNLCFANIEQRKTMRDGREVHLVTLKVIDSHEIGSGRRDHAGLWIRLAKACWHACAHRSPRRPAAV